MVVYQRDSVCLIDSEYLFEECVSKKNSQFDIFKFRNILECLARHTKITPQNLEATVWWRGNSAYNNITLITPFCDWEVSFLDVIRRAYPGGPHFGAVFYPPSIEEIICTNSECSKRFLAVKKNTPMGMITEVFSAFQSDQIQNVFIVADPREISPLLSHFSQNHPKNLYLICLQNSNHEFPADFPSEKIIHLDDFWDLIGRNIPEDTSTSLQEKTPIIEDVPVFIKGYGRAFDVSSKARVRANDATGNPSTQLQFYKQLDSYHDQDCLYNCDTALEVAFRSENASCTSTPKICPQEEEEGEDAMGICDPSKYLLNGSFRLYSQYKKDNQQIFWIYKTCVKNTFKAILSAVLPSSAVFPLNESASHKLLNEYQNCFSHNFCGANSDYFFDYFHHFQSSQDPLDSLHGPKAFSEWQDVSTKILGTHF